jgi:hypothetical protein
VADELVPSTDPGRLRASNADRERVAGVLHTAMAEGRLTVGELQERLDAVYASKTVGELEPLTRDLPGHQPLAAAPSPLPAAGGRVGGYPTSTTAIAVMSGAERKGRWVVPRQFHAVAFWGGIEIDLTQARFAEAEVSITAIAVMGGIEIIADDSVTVVVDGVGVMGAFEDHVRSEPVPGRPVVRVNGFAFWGGIEVRRPKSGSKVPGEIAG